MVDGGGRSSPFAHQWWAVICHPRGWWGSDMAINGQLSHGDQWEGWATVVLGDGGAVTWQSMGGGDVVTSGQGGLLTSCRTTLTAWPIGHS